MDWVRANVTNSRRLIEILTENEVDGDALCTCDDDILHYENMTVNDKRSDAPLYAESQAMYQKAKNKHNYWKCEQYMEEALRMIRKTDGEYPTE